MGMMLCIILFSGMEDKSYCVVNYFLFCSTNLDKELKYDRQKLEANRGLTQQHHQLLQQKVSKKFITIIILLCILW